jgi:hypothetical protein
MKIELSADQLAHLHAFLSAFEDSESLSESEFVLDLFDLNPPLSLDLILMKDGLLIEGAAELLFDEALDGWYIGERILSAQRIRRALVDVGAIDV